MTVVASSGGVAVALLHDVKSELRPWLWHGGILWIRTLKGTVAGNALAWMMDRLTRERHLHLVYVPRVLLAFRLSNPPDCP